MNESQGKSESSPDLPSKVPNRQSTTKSHPKTRVSNRTSQFVKKKTKLKQTFVSSISSSGENYKNSKSSFDEDKDSSLISNESGTHSKKDQDDEERSFYNEIVKMTNKSEHQKSSKTEKEGKSDNTMERKKSVHQTMNFNGDELEALNKNINQENGKIRREMRLSEDLIDEKSVGTFDEKRKKRLMTF